MDCTGETAETAAWAMIPDPNQTKPITKKKRRDCAHRTYTQPNRFMKQADESYQELQ
jgi:hypothetical protein